MISLTKEELSTVQKNPNALNLCFLLEEDFDGCFDYAGCYPITWALPDVQDLTGDGQKRGVDFAKVGGVKLVVYIGERCSVNVGFYEPY